MSWKVASECIGRKFGSPVRKQVIMYLADKASDDGDGIWCSKGTIVRECELGLSTVKRAISEFLEEGILREYGTRKHSNGITKFYQINLENVRKLELLKPKPNNPNTPPPLDGVQSEPSKPPATNPQDGSERTTNNPKTIQKPSIRARGDWDLGTKFVPQGTRDVDLDMWRMGLEDLGIYQLERVFELRSRSGKEGYLIPSQLPPKNPERRKEFLEAWLKAQGKTVSFCE